MSGRTKFEIFINANDLDYFRKCAEAAAALKPYGQVQLLINNLAEKSSYEMPPGGSGWHEYTCYMGPVHKFFPHPDIAKHIPAEHVAKNRELLLGKVAILQELGLDALYYGQDPYFLPESFFREFPSLRGARVDHPPRSCEVAHAMCVDQPRSLEVMEWMVAELRRQVPNLGTYLFNTNDAGAGFCWSDYNYPGANGPRKCQTRNMGERMKGFLEAIHRGAEKGGGPVSVRMRSNISRFECDTLEPLLPPNTVLRGKNRTPRGYATTGSLLVESDPVYGIIDPLDIIETMARASSGSVHTVMLHFMGHYQRVREPIDVIERAIGIAVKCLEKPSRGQIECLQMLASLCEEWAGKEQAETLFEAFSGLNKALAYRAFGCGGEAGLYKGVSTRHVTRPMVVRPDLLTAEEEDYFYPFLFDAPKGLGRNDYMLVHAGRKRVHATGWYWNPQLQSVFGMMGGSVGAFEKLGDTPSGPWLKQLALSLKMYMSVLRSVDNFYFAQAFRNVHKDLLMQEPVKLAAGPDRQASDHLQWNEIARDETDNVAELIELLEGGGLDYFAHASKAELEDTFLLGPNVVDDLKKKLEITLKHWRDLEQYVAPLSK